MAYQIHTDIGNHTTGATVNGKIVPLDYEVKNGDIVDIKTSANSAGPNRDWLKLVSTRRARNKIKQFFRQKDREKNVAEGQDIIARQLRDMKFDPKEIMTKENLAKVVGRLHYQHVDDLYAAVGFGDLQPVGVANRLTEDVRHEREEARQRQEERELLEEHQSINNETQESDTQRKRKQKASEGVIIEGVDNLLVRLSHCCSPVPGDAIVGYITKGRGVSVHRKDCPNVAHAEANGERLIDVHWENPNESTSMYNADLEVQGYNRNGLLNEVLRIVNNTTKQLNLVNGKVDHNKMVTISISLGTRNAAQLQRIIDNLKNIQDVYVVKRPFR